MRKFFTLLAREIRSYFYSSIAYIVLVFFLLVTGVDFYFQVSFMNQRAVPFSVQEAFFNSVFFWFAFILIFPLITMRLFAEEFKLGTIEPLMTAPVRDWQVVLGKWLGAVGLIAAMLIATLEFPALLYVFAEPKPDFGPILCAYVGLLLAGMAYTAVGTMVSSTTNSQVVAWIVSLVVLLVLWLVGWFEYAAASNKNVLTEVAVYLSINEHFRNIAEGVLTSKAALFFLSLAAFPLFLASRILEGLRTQ